MKFLPMICSNTDQRKKGKKKSYAPKASSYSNQWLHDVCSRCGGCSPFIYTLHLFYSCVVCHVSKVWDRFGDASDQTSIVLKGP